MNNIAQILEQIINAAVKKNASDIHLEPAKEQVKIRFRIDGTLMIHAELIKDIHQPLVSRIKIMANLDIAESRLPQDGSCSIGLFDLRVSSIPTILGEKIVIRILYKEQTALSLTELGMTSEQLTLYSKMIQASSGLILVSGATGSGKTTTLYATLKELKTNEKNIITIEDPVEYHLPGITQIQVNNKTGLTFARGLRSILRQDPDIILIGEIRDIETAQIAIQSALTGHLVFATLHANNAEATVIRLVEMGIEEYLVKATLIGAISQKLLAKKQGGRVGCFEVKSYLEQNQAWSLKK